MNGRLHRHALLAGLLFSGIFASRSGSAAELTQQDRVQVDTLLEQLAPSIAARKAEGTQGLLTWTELTEPLGEAQRGWLQTFRYRNGLLNLEEVKTPQLIQVEEQFILQDGKALALPKQYLPVQAYHAYKRMMQAMEAALDTYLRVDSGYRSPAYQMYLFLEYLPKHGYSVNETHRYVAFPGESEHGSLLKPAVDFINVQGINGEENPRDFEVLPEFRWLTLHAADYGFELSYPVETSMDAYEPWHWRYVGEP